MGIIAKQSTQNTLYSYIGAVIGYVNTAILVVDHLTTEEFGLTQYILSVVLLSSSFLGLGFGNITARLFPYFRNDKNAHNGYLTLGLIVTSVSGLLTIVLYYTLGSYYLEDKTSIYGEDFGFLLVPVIIFNLFYNFLDSFFRMNFKTRIGVFFREVGSRLATTVSILLFAFGYVNYEVFVYLFMASFILPTPVLLLKLIIDGDFVLVKPRPFLLKKLGKAMLGIAFFGLITGLSNVAILNLDRIMIRDMIGFAEVGVYTMGFYFATLILFPMRSIKRISTTVLSEAWKRKDLHNIESVYRKSSITMLIIGLYIFIGIWGNIDSVMAILKSQYESARYVIFFIGLSNLILMISGVNLEIISTSKKYIYASVFMVITLVLIVITNFTLIPMWGIIGAAVASLISTFVFALMRYLLVWKSFGLQPLSYHHLLILLIGFVAWGVAYICPSLENPFFDILLKGTIITAVFFPSIYLSRTSEDLNQKMEEALAFVKKLF